MQDKDELCNTCAQVNLYSLFTGPRYFSGCQSGSRITVKLGTLEEVKSNHQCPLCRLVRHIWYENRLKHTWDGVRDELNLSKVRCQVTPVRIDYYEETSYLNNKTRDMLATMLEVRLVATDDCPKEEADHIIGGFFSEKCIQLLSPGSVDPLRPLLNGHRATSLENSMQMLSSWIKTCQESHGETCRLKQIPSSQKLIRVINVKERTLVSEDSTKIKYAALSYVWGETTESCMRPVGELAQKQILSGATMVHLPKPVPQVVEDSIQACLTLDIPYLWVDFYCVDQEDPERKAAEIRDMGHIYRRSTITFVAGVSNKRKTIENSQPTQLFGESHRGDIGRDQRIETINGHSYITSMPGSFFQIQGSEWSRRSWTFQEGQFARRIAFFGRQDVLFMCGAGHWRDSLHSGIYGHEGDMAGIDLRSTGYHILSATSWLSTAKWSFADYVSIIMVYSGRELSYESDKLNAISGCLDMISERKGMHFLRGLPSLDFHYALLWSGEYDCRREGFPSWTWAGWYALQNRYNIYPQQEDSGSRMEREDGESFSFTESSPPDIELGGLLISLTERSHLANKCSQRLADIQITKSLSIIKITSEVARFFIDIRASEDTDAATTKRARGRVKACFPAEFDSTASHDAKWDPNTEYKTPFGRLSLRDVYGNTYNYFYPFWYKHLPVLMLHLPSTLRGSTLTWLLRDGIELIKIVEVKLLEGDEQLEQFHHVLCLGIDQSAGPGRCARMGTFVLPKEVWDLAKPRRMTVEMC